MKAATAQSPAVLNEPGAVEIFPWYTSGSMYAYFSNRGVHLPSQVIPDTKPHPFASNGVLHYYVAGVDEGSGPFVVAFLPNVPLPIFVGVRYQIDERPDLYKARCAHCMQRWFEAGGGQI